MAPRTTMLAGTAAANARAGVVGAAPGNFGLLVPLRYQWAFAGPLRPSRSGRIRLLHGPNAGRAVQAMTQQATRHARRVYVGGLSAMANEQNVAGFFNEVMSVIGGKTAARGNPVVHVYIDHEKKFAFVEMRFVEEASNAMALDGIIFQGAPVKVRRPIDYNPSLAAALGPSQPNPNLNLAAVELALGSAGGLEGPDRIFVGGLPDPSLAAALGPSQPNPNLNLAAVELALGSAGGLEGPDRIFVGGLPDYFNEGLIRELLESFGPLRGFGLVKDRETGNSKGYAFCVYQDLSVTDIVCTALNGIKMGDKTLTVRRVNQGASQPKPEQETVLYQVQRQMQDLSVTDIASATPSGIKMGDKTLTVRRANQGASQPKPEQETVLYQVQQQMQRLSFRGGPDVVPTRVVCLPQVVTADELSNDDEYQDIVEDMREEGGKYGNLVKVAIPRPNPSGEPSPGVGKVFLEYADVVGASKARTGLNGRKFGGNQVVAIYYPEKEFAQGDYDA